MCCSLAGLRHVQLTNKSFPSAHFRPRNLDRKHVTPTCVRPGVEDKKVKWGVGNGRVFDQIGCARLDQFERGDTVREYVVTLFPKAEVAKPFHVPVNLLRSLRRIRSPRNTY